MVIFFVPVFILERLIITRNLRICRSLVTAAILFSCHMKCNVVLLLTRMKQSLISPGRGGANRNIYREMNVIFIFKKFKSTIYEFVFHFAYLE